MLRPRVAICLAVLGLTLFSARPTQAQAAPAKESASSHVQAVAPPAPSATPIAPAAPVVPIRAYGILWTAVFAGQPLSSYGNSNFTAPTASAHPALYAHPDESLLSFQVQQTRAGVVVGEGTPLKGTLEVDFIHFDQATPLAQAYPRIRVALLEWKMREHHKLFAGQTWDLFGDAIGPQLLSHSYNLVGTLFQAGNIGFMRQQFGWVGSFGQLEVASAVGLQGANNGPTFNNIEQARVPTASLRVMFHLPDNHGVVGVSGIGTALRMRQPSTGSAQYQPAAGAQLFTDSTFGPLNIHSELYFAQNLANTGALNLGHATYDQNVRDVGGYLSGKLTLGRHALTAMYGAARVLNPDDMAPSYRYIEGTAGAAATRSVVGANGPGIRWNMTAHVGYWYSPYKGLSLVLEPYVYATRFKLASQDAGKVDGKNVSWGGSLGAMYQF